MPHQELWINTILGCATSALGFLVALLVNSYVELWREKKTCHAMLMTIKAEARNNAVILNESFLKFYRDGIVLREFFLASVIQCYGSSPFIKHADSSEMEVLNAYLRNLKLANSYREKAEYLTIKEGREAKKWLDAIVEYWGVNLSQCEGSINQVLSLPEG